jgi:sugar-phosphatase
MRVLGDPSEAADTSPRLLFCTSALLLNLEGTLVDRTRGIASVTWMPGAREFVGRIPVERWAVVASGDRRLAEANMAKAGVPTPLVLVTADDVRQGEPQSDPFLLAAQALRVPRPSMCVALEDSPVGVESARAAGMRVLGVATTVDPARLAAANWVVPNLLGVRVTSIPDGLIVELLPRLL